MTKKVSLAPVKWTKEGLSEWWFATPANFSDVLEKHLENFIEEVVAETSVQIKGQFKEDLIAALTQSECSLRLFEDGQDTMTLLFYSDDLSESIGKIEFGSFIDEVESGLYEDIEHSKRILAILETAVSAVKQHIKKHEPTE